MAVKWLSLTLLTTVMILVSDLQVCNGCVEEERLSLLRIKSMFLSYNNNSIDHYSENYDDDPFVSWDGSNCCNWDRVQCDTSGTYVLGLLLDSLLPFHYHFRLEGNDYPLLNLSLFQNFKELKTLDLAYNGFTDFTEKQGFNNFSSFNKLETLNLSVTHFGNKILSSLNGLNSLKTLRLSGNRLNGSMTLLGLKNLTSLDLSFNDWKVFPRLQGLRNLRELDLSSNEMQGFHGFSRLNKLEILNVKDNNFNNSIFSSLKGLISLKILSLGGNFGLRGIIPTEDIANLRGLEILDLSNHNYYDGAIPLQDLKNLKVLNLAHNQFNGSLPIQGFCEANNLIELKLRNNKIKGELSECVGNFTKLKVVDISYNEFSGKIPTTISKLTSMEYLSLEENDFEGTFSFSSLANHSNLRHFHLLGGNNIQVETEELHEWQPKFQLETLSMPSCNLNHQTASKFPTFLLSQHKLKYLDLSHNHLVGPFPFWLLHNNSALNSLDLRNNSLSGPLQLSTKNHTRLRHLQISSNNFSGQLPTHLGLLLPQVDHFDISKNSFQGNLPPSMKQMKMLCWLDASNNNFSGDLQISMFDNTFSLQFLLLANNFFSGNIEDAWKIKKYLLALDISNNMISGKIPTWIGSLEGLQYVQMSRNHFVGELPIQICSLFELTMLDVAQNQLVGEIPLTCFNSSSLVYLYMRKNEFSKPIRQGLLSSTASILKVIDLSYNNFSGYIPKWFNKFTSLRVLLLKGNELEGPIPTQLCQITKISIMDLSNNKLSGSIPSCFNNITFGDIKVNQTDNPNFSDLEVASDTSDVDTDNGCGNINIYSRICYMFNTYASTVQVEVDFTTKHRYESYKGNILNYMSGLDLSSNQLTGDIPLQIGDLVQIHALNLSYNKLVGNIPKVFSNLKQLESLDISNNLLSGHIPSELATLDYLSIFDVSYNNLSGMIPTAPHFTYPPSSFYGNPNLCGSYIEPKCSSPTLPRDNQLYEKLELEIDDGGLIDLEALFWSFAASYMILLLGFGAVLWINLQWRQRWFYFIEDCCYLFCKLT